MPQTLSQVYAEGGMDLTGIIQGFATDFGAQVTSALPIIAGVSVLIIGGFKGISLIKKVIGKVG